MADRITIYDNLKERGLNLWDALSRSADEYFSSKPSFSPSQPFDMQYYVDGNYLPPLQDSVQRDVGNAVAKGVLDTVTNPVGYVKDLYYGIADPAVSAYENTSASLPQYGNAALQRLQGDDNTEAMNIADKYSANAITSLGLLGLGIAEVLPSGKVTKPVKGLLDDVDDLGFYSPTERLATTLQPKGTGQQYLGILAKGDGKGSRIQEEMQDMGLDTWLQNKGKVSRDEVLDYISENRLRYGKKVGRNQWSQSDEDILAELEDRASRKVRTPPDTDFNPQYQKFSQEGGTNYQEGLLTVPSEANKDIIIKEMEADSLGNPRYRAIHRQSGLEVSDRGMVITGGSPDEVMRRAEATIEAEGGKAGAYRSPHYDQANIGLTTRTQSFNTPDGNSVHLMDELQSDWHKEGKKKGYNTGDAPEGTTDIGGILGDIVNSVTDARVPNAPAKQSWINQGIKKEINQTIADGKDYFAWTGGDIQADRYPLRKHIEGLEVIPSFEDGMVDVLIKPKGQDYQGISDGIIPKEDLHRYVGKEMADKALAHLDATSSYNQADLDAVINSFGDEDIMEAWVEKTPKTATYPNGRWQGRFQHPDVFEGDFQVTGHGTTEQEALEILEKDFRELAKMSFAEPEPFYAEGLDLKVGGEGMKSFYDKDVKKRTEKIIKRLDPKAKVEVIELDNGNKVWGVKITDQMRDKVKGEGMPLYSIAPIAGAGLLGAGMMRQEEQQPQQGLLN